MKVTGKAMIILFVVLTALLAVNVPAFAREGLYLGVQLPYDDIQGDFDDNLAPSVDPGIGNGVIVGYGITPYSSFHF